MWSAKKCFTHSSSMPSNEITTTTPTAKAKRVSKGSSFTTALMDAWSRMNRPTLLTTPWTTPKTTPARTNPGRSLSTMRTANGHLLGLRCKEAAMESIWFATAEASSSSTRLNVGGVVAGMSSSVRAVTRPLRTIGKNPQMSHKVLHPTSFPRSTAIRSDTPCCLLRAGWSREIGPMFPSSQ